MQVDRLWGLAAAIRLGRRKPVARTVIHKGVRPEGGYVHKDISIAANLA